ncbi:death effector domain-containing 1 [Polypterus senegalus]|uniref:death effector domain-containing 1 n=1 Tax=Polypterus senegalus TaxID=55291 RepID=UPI001962A961|nr:death effector domain-containing 1 [Polypterus senegalus]
MSGQRRPLITHSWEENECLTYYGMQSLHEMFDVIGSHLTDNDVEALSFLLEELYPASHPLDPTTWVVDRAAEDDLGPEDNGPSPSLLRAWQRYQRTTTTNSNQLLCTFNALRPKNGVELLLQLEKRGLCNESSFNHLLQLLRILTRHDLISFVTQKRRRTVSPERYSYEMPTSNSKEEGIEVKHDKSPKEPISGEGQWRAGVDPNLSHSTSHTPRRGKKRRSGKLHKPRARGGESSLLQSSPVQDRVTCDIRLRVRAEYCEHDSILNGNVVSNKQHALERQFELFNQSNTILKSRDLGSIICDIKFSELSYLDAFWNDYLNGSLLEALKGVFITDSLKQAVGQEAIRLLVNVDEDDYEEGRRLLLENHPLQ